MTFSDSPIIQFYMKQKKYNMRVVRGAFTDPDMLDVLGAKTIEKLDRNEWQSVDEVVVDLDQIKLLQKNMVKHYETPDPWYMDGYGLEDKDEIIVAFGADDGEGGKIFQFRRTDTAAYEKVIEYGMSKGIPKEELDFFEIDFSNTVSNNDNKSGSPLSR
jgi:hypothetical protein